MDLMACTRGRGVQRVLPEMTQTKYAKCTRNHGSSGSSSMFWQASMSPVPRVLALHLVP